MWRGVASRRSVRPMSMAGLCLVSLLAGSVALASSDDVAALRQEMSELKEAVQRLDARVQGLEHRLNPSNDAAASAKETETTPAPAPPVVGRSKTKSARVLLQEQWQKVKAGMTLQETEALLGRPDRTVQLPGKTVWHYSYPDIGSGSVVFAADGSVIDWQTPPFSTWW